MNVALLIAGVLVVVALMAIVVERARVRTIRRIDDVTRTLRGDLPMTSNSLDTAIDRLQGAAERGQELVPAERIEAQRYRASLQSMNMGVVLLNESGEMVFRNAYAAGFLDGRHGDAVVGQAVDELAVEALSSAAAAEREVQLYSPPRKTLFVVATPIRDDGFELGVVVLIDDVTEQERLDAIRRDFVANISHELRTPIGAISLLAETLADEPDPVMAATLAARLSSESERLANTIDDLLQLSRIEHGADDDFTPVVVQHVIHLAHDRVRAAAEQRDVDLGLTLPDRDLLVRGDAIQLTSAVFNLLDNGVKYIGPDGGVVSVRAREVGDQVEIVVQDSGIGIPRNDLDRVFERFYRVDRARSRASGGTGLGLAIVRHVVANHGGRIEVSSIEGDGTTFTMHLPVLRWSDDEPRGQDRPLDESPERRDDATDSEAVNRE